MEVKTASRLTLTVFILACVHWVVSLVCCCKHKMVLNIASEGKKLVKSVTKGKLGKIVKLPKKVKNYWSVSLLVVTAIVILSGLVQFSYFADEEDE